MDASSRQTSFVQVVGPNDGWVLEKIARRLVSKLPYAKFSAWKPERPRAGQIIYYVNYALFESATDGIDIGFFTHLDEQQGFLERARRMDHCICMSKKYADVLRKAGIENVTHIPMGFDFHGFRPKLQLAVIGLLDHPRKGRTLLEKVRSLPFVDVCTSDGKLSTKDLVALYRRVDYVLILSTIEGGPLCLLEALAIGTPVIAPREVGFVPEFSETEHLLLFDAGDWESLRRRLEECGQKKSSSRSLVRDRTWDSWAKQHHEVFQRITKQQNGGFPDPHPAFRFGLLEEIEIPLTTDAFEVEDLVDRISAHLYFGEIDAASKVAEELSRDHPCTRPIAASISAGQRIAELPSPGSQVSRTTKLDKGESPSTVLTIVSAYYNNSANLRGQLAAWNRFPPELKQKIAVVLVDDCSPQPLQIEEAPNLNLTICRIDEDVAFNNPGARNVGANIAQDGWILFLDIDHVADADFCEKILLLNPSDPGTYYTFARDSDHVAPPNLFIIHRKTFWDLGGYDEDFAGNYGSDDIVFRNLMDRRLHSIHLPFLVRYEHWSEYDPSTKLPSRDTAPNERLLHEKLADPHYRPVRPLRLPWHIVTRYTYHGPTSDRHDEQHGGKQIDQARDWAAAGRFGEAKVLFAKQLDLASSPNARADILNDLAVIDAIEGNYEHAVVRLREAVELGSVLAVANLNSLEGSETHRERGRSFDLAFTSDSRPKIVILSFLFNWPSTGGGIVHTVELAKFLSLAGFEVRHFYARNSDWGIGRLDDPIFHEAIPLDFSNDEMNIPTIQGRFRRAVDGFGPDHVIITDSWNTKPVLAQAVSGYRYYLRLQAMECLCPLNNVRLLPPENGRFVQCALDQLAHPQDCANCLARLGKYSGGLHQAERQLCAVGSEEYDAILREAFRNAASVLVVHPQMQELIRPHARDVRVVPSGMDAARFPWPISSDVFEDANGTRKRILFAGLVEERIKGFDVALGACKILARTRDDFELVATGQMDGLDHDFVRFVGWKSQQELPDLIRSCYVLVFPTIAQEALGRTAVEAMACGRPVVASRLGGLPYTLGEGKAGILVEPGDPVELAQKLEVLLDNPELAESMGQAGRRRFEEHYTWDVIIERQYRPLFSQNVSRPEMQEVVSGT